MAILKDLIVHGSSRFLNKIYASEIQTPLIDAEAGVFKKLKADDATVVGLLDVQGQMHTNSWTNSNIATIDGSFYITPTLSSSSGTVSFSSATAATFTGTYSAVSSLYIGNDTASTVQWTSGSKILITGEVQVDEEWIPLGTLLGTLNSTNPTTSMPIVNITDNRNNTSNILTNIYSLKSNDSLSYRNLKISLYQRADNSQYYPLGIYITALGQNGKTFLDIYGGVNALTTSYGGYANPNVRIGNLSGLPAITTAAGNFTPVGWGIYTTNGYFSGTIVSNTGVIGGWKLGANSLYNETAGLNDNTVGIYLGTDGIRNYLTSTQYVNITGGKIIAQGVDLTGEITATSGTIGGCTISNGTLIVKNANINDINASKINAGDIAAARIETNLISAINAKVSDLSALTATIGGFQIDSSSVHTNNVVVTSNADNSIALSSTDFTRTINSISRTGLRFAIGDKFGVTGDGIVYASDVDLTGKITATSGTIGRINIINGDLDVSSINIGDLNGASNYALKTEITDAEKVATSYITYIDSTEGIKIHNISDQTNYLKLNSSAISMYRNNVETLNINNNEVRIGKINGNNVFIDNTSVNIREGQSTLASFGVDGMQIGLNNETRTEQDYHSWKMVDKDDNIYAFVSDLRDENGEATITETVKLNEATNWAETNFEIDSIIDVTVNGNAPDSYKKMLSNFIKIEPEPTDEDVIVVTYISQSSELKAYTFGKRYLNSSIGGYSFAEGVNCTSSGYSSHAEGIACTSSRQGSHAEGASCISSGQGSHAEGIHTKASGRGSHAQNFVTTASSMYQTTIGKYNIDDANNKYAFIIGNGGFDQSNSTYRYSNAFTVDWDGNTEIAGDLTVTGKLIADRFGGSYLPTNTNIDNFTKNDSGWWVYSRSDTSGTFPINDDYGTICHIQGTSNNVAMQFLRSNSQIPTIYGRYKMAGQWGTWVRYVDDTTTNLTITRVNNSYMDATSVGYLQARRKGGYLSLRGNFSLSASMPTNTAETVVARISGWNGVSGYFIAAPQNANFGNLLVCVTADGRFTIANYSGKACAGWYRFVLTTPCNDGYE